ncbi:hypothetical protein [Hymenobacter metallicola]|uniref:Glycerophosphoryl diester phosphodiesterase membrane domain-containing protein n=1 Tax=Hymenobacter metallicola TaxID=2563114 RepID=A0A4Z0Q1I4_9BACT|nr:hypothetical protein [Hymenobacter metallicola]TGE23033.1 hypothetical protein E5K02_22020 [Hymenobacter metallicola]
MQSTYTHTADLRQERDFGKKIGATFEFIAAHFRPLGKCLLYFVLPPALLMGVGLGLVTNVIWNEVGKSINNAAQAGSSPDFFTPVYFSGFAIAALSGLISFILLLVTVYSYVRLVLVHEQVPTPAQVWQDIKSRIGRLIMAFMFLFGIYIMLIALVTGLTALSDSFALLFVVLFPLIIYIMVPLSLYFPVLWLEEGGVWQALLRCFYLIKGKWWSTLGLLFVAGMIQSMLSMLFALPQYAVLFGKMLKIPGLESDVFGVITQCLFVLGIMVTYTIPLLAIVFQYFNLVERREGLGLRSLVDSIGQGPAPVAYNQAYRPDDEGEY